MSERYRIDPVEDLGVLIDALDEHQPTSVPLLTLATSVGLGRRLRVATVRCGQSPAAVVAHHHIGPLRWEALVFVVDDDPECLDLLATAIDRGPATVVAGFESHCRLLAPRLDRLEGSAEVRDVLTIEPGFGFVGPDPAVRWAVADDIDALVDLYWRSGGHGFVFRRQVAAWMRRCVDNGEILVHQGPGDASIAGFGQVTLASRYGHIAELVVAPDHRRQGIGLAIVSHMAALAIERGLGGIGIFASTNPVPIPADLFHDDPWWLMRLHPPGRARVTRRGRRAVTALLDRRVPRPDDAVFRPPDRSTGPADAASLDRWRRR